MSGSVGGPLSSSSVRWPRPSEAVALIRTIASGPAQPVAGRMVETGQDGRDRPARAERSGSRRALRPRPEPRQPARFGR